MTVFTRAQLKELTNQPPQHSVSLFMPVQARYAQLAENLSLLQRLVATAEQRLLERGIVGPEVNQLLDPIRHLQNHQMFWCSNGDGLAAFSSAQLFRAYRVPWHLSEHIYVGTSFSVAPLLPLLESGGRYYILALTDESARLYEASQHSIQQISLELNGPQLGANQSPMPETTNGKWRALEFCRGVNRCVNQILEGQDSPLVLACVGHLSDIYRLQNSYRGLLKAKIPGNPKLWSVDELRQRAWEHVAPVFRAQKEHALQQYCAAIGSDRVASGVHAVVQAANQGRIDTLLVGQQPVGDCAQFSWLGSDGRLSDDLLCQAATQTLSHGGSVVMLDRLPVDHSPLAALLRS